VRLFQEIGHNDIISREKILAFEEGIIFSKFVFFEMIIHGDPKRLDRHVVYLQAHLSEHFLVIKTSSPRFKVKSIKQISESDDDKSND